MVGRTWLAVVGRFPWSRRWTEGREEERDSWDPTFRAFSADPPFPGSFPIIPILRLPRLSSGIIKSRRDLISFPYSTKPFWFVGTCQEQGPVCVTFNFISSSFCPTAVSLPTSSSSPLPYCHPIRFLSLKSPSVSESPQIKNIKTCLSFPFSDLEKISFDFLYFCPRVHVSIKPRLPWMPLTITFECTQAPVAPLPPLPGTRVSSRNLSRNWTTPPTTSITTIRHPQKIITTTTTSSTTRCTTAAGAGQRQWTWKGWKRMSSRSLLVSTPRPHLEV